MSQHPDTQPYFVSRAAPTTRTPCYCDRLKFPHRFNRACSDLADEREADALDADPIDYDREANDAFTACEARGINDDTVRARR